MTFRAVKILRRISYDGHMSLFICPSLYKIKGEL